MDFEAGGTGGQADRVLLNPLVPHYGRDRIRNRRQPHRGHLSGDARGQGRSDQGAAIWVRKSKVKRKRWKKKFHTFYFLLSTFYFLLSAFDPLFHSPDICTTTSRLRGRLSKSINTICCQVPSSNRPSLNGTVSEHPSSAARTCEWPLPSCQVSSW